MRLFHSLRCGCGSIAEWLKRQAPWSGGRAPQQAQQAPEMLSSGLTGCVTDHQFHGEVAQVGAGGRDAGLRFQGHGGAFHLDRGSDEVQQKGCQSVGPRPSGDQHFEHGAVFAQVIQPLVHCRAQGLWHGSAQILNAGLWAKVLGSVQNGLGKA